MDGKKVITDEGYKFEHVIRTYDVNNDKSVIFTNVIPNDATYLYFISVQIIPYYGGLGEGYVSINAQTRITFTQGYSSWGYASSGPLYTSDGLSPTVYWSVIANNSVVRLDVSYRKLQNP